MKPPVHLRALGALAGLPFAVHAASDTWDGGSDPANTNWNDVTNWVMDTQFPNGVDDVATFILGANLTVTNNLETQPLTLGGIVLSHDATGGSKNLTVTGGTLRLETSSGQPLLEAASPGRTIQINSVIDGTQGFIRRAPNASTRLQLASPTGNTFTGQVTIESGNIVFSNGNDSLLGETGLGNETILAGGGLNVGSQTRASKEDFIIQSSSIGCDTSANGVATFTGVIDIQTTGATTSVVNANPTVNANTYRFDFNGPVTGGGESGMRINLNNANGNVRVALNNGTNDFVGGVSLNQGGGTPGLLSQSPDVTGPNGTPKLGSVGLLIGDDNALSTGALTIATNVSRSSISSSDGNARTLANEIIWIANSGTNDPNSSSYGAPYTLGLGTDGAGDITFNGPFSVDGGVSDIQTQTFNVQNAVTAINGVFSSDDQAKLIKAGPGTLVLANPLNEVLGSFAVNEGLLRLDGLLGGTGLTVNSGGTLGGTGTVATTTTVASGGTIAPGASTGTLNLQGNTNLAGTYACELDGGSNDLLDVTGDVDLTGSTLAVSELGGGATQGTYVILTYSGTRTGEFTVAPELPAGYAVSYDTPGQVQLVSGAPVDPFTSWATTNITSIDSEADATFGGDPDLDGIENALEWVLGGNPLASDSSGSLVQSEGTAAGGLVLTFNRADETLGQLVLSANYSVDLFASDDNSATIGETSSGPDGNGVTVSVVDNGATDQVTVTIPPSNAPDGKLFGRIVATPNP